MKSVVNVAEAAKEKPFPKLMIHNDGYILLMSSPKEGTVISVPKVTFHKIGHHAYGLVEANFTDFNGTVTLSND